MSAHPAHVRRVIDALLAESSKGGSVELDRIGELVGAQAFSSDEIEAVIAALEHAGRRVVSPKSEAKNDLAAVLAAARAIQNETGARATIAAIAARTGLDPDAVRAALALGTIMGR